jgi:hypothetical protein
VYVVIALAVFLILSLMFGGFHKGTFHGGLGRPVTPEKAAVSRIVPAQLL